MSRRSAAAAAAQYRRSARAKQFVVVALAASCTLSACSGTEEGEFAADESVIDQENPSPLDQYRSGELSFADPADHGYEPVADTDDYHLDEVEQPALEVDEPAQVLAETPKVDPGDGELLSAVDPVDEAPSPGEAPDRRDGKHRNEIGELVTIDDGAALACGNAEIAITALDEGDTQLTADHLARSITFAAESATDGMADWSQTLEADMADGTPDPTVLVGFLKACSEGGYEL